MRAAKVDANQVRIVGLLRLMGCTVTHLHRVGEGCPDLLIGIHGIWALIECKDGKKPPSSRALTQAQIKWWDDNQNGGPRAIVNSPEEAAEFVNTLGWRYAKQE